MQTITNTKATRKSKPYKYLKQAAIFNRYRFNHPSNPFRSGAHKYKEHIVHPKNTDINDGIIVCFEKLLKAIQRIVVTPEQKKLSHLSTLCKELDRALYTFSTVPCTANINKDIFEHLNYLLELLEEWQHYAYYLRKIDAAPITFLNQSSVQKDIPIDELIIKVQYLRKLFAQQTKEIISEIHLIQKRINQEYQKRYPKYSTIKKNNK